VAWAALHARNGDHAKRIIIDSYEQIPNTIGFFYVKRRPADWVPFSGRFPAVDWMTGGLVHWSSRDRFGGKLVIPPHAKHPQPGCATPGDEPSWRGSPPPPRTRSLGEVMAKIAQGATGTISVFHCRADASERRPFSHGLPTIPWRCPSCDTDIIDPDELTYDVTAE
jgi:hypothetical protein